MPTLHSHTHCQAAQASHTNQSLSKSVPEATHGRPKSKHDYTTGYIKNWADRHEIQGFSYYRTFGFGDMGSFRNVQLFIYQGRWGELNK